MGKKTALFLQKSFATFQIITIHVTLLVLTQLFKILVCDVQFMQVCLW